MNNFFAPRNDIDFDSVPALKRVSKNSYHGVQETTPCGNLFVGRDARFDVYFVVEEHSQREASRIDGDIITDYEKNINNKCVKIIIGEIKHKGYPGLERFRAF